MAAGVVVYTKYKLNMNPNINPNMNIWLGIHA